MYFKVILGTKQTNWGNININAFEHIMSFQNDINLRDEFISTQVFGVSDYKELFNEAPLTNQDFISILSAKLTLAPTDFSNLTREQFLGLDYCVILRDENGQEPDENGNFPNPKYFFYHMTPVLRDTKSGASSGMWYADLTLDIYTNEDFFVERLFKQDVLTPVVRAHAPRLKDKTDTRYKYYQRDESEITQDIYNFPEDFDGGLENKVEYYDSDVRNIDLKRGINCWWIYPITPPDYVDGQKRTGYVFINRTFRIGSFRTTDFSEWANGKWSSPYFICRLENDASIINKEETSLNALTSNFLIVSEEWATRSASQNPFALTGDIKLPFRLSNSSAKFLYEIWYYSGNIDSHGVDSNSGDFDGGYASTQNSFEPYGNTVYTLDYTGDKINLSLNVNDKWNYHHETKLYKSPYSFLKLYDFQGDTLDINTQFIVDNSNSALTVELNCYGYISPASQRVGIVVTNNFYNQNLYFTIIDGNNDSFHNYDIMTTRLTKDYNLQSLQNFNNDAQYKAYNQASFNNQQKYAFRDSIQNYINGGTDMVKGIANTATGIGTENLNMALSGAQQTFNAGFTIANARKEIDNLKTQQQDRQNSPTQINNMEIAYYQLSTPLKVNINSKSINLNNFNLLVEPTENQRIPFYTILPMFLPENLRRAIGWMFNISGVSYGNTPANPNELINSRYHHNFIQLGEPYNALDIKTPSYIRNIISGHFMKGLHIHHYRNKSTFKGVYTDFQYNNVEMEFEPIETSDFNE